MGVGVASHATGTPQTVTALGASVSGAFSVTTDHASTDAKQVSHSRHVPKPQHLVQATVLARQSHHLSRAQLHALRQVPGVQQVDIVSVGSARIDHKPAHVLAGDPATLRPWTPGPTAKSNALWTTIASGELTASFDMGHQARLPLGQTVPVASARRTPMRIGAFATVGMAGIDAVVNGHEGRALGLPQHNALLINAPHADALTLRADVDRLLGKGGTATLLREVVVIRDAGEFMTRTQLATMLHAAESRLGKPYVWGATGPNSFDCSGLVQWSFARAGITMPRVSEDQFFAGPHIRYADARPGDLLFWHYDPTDPTDVDHVAIYLGNGQMIAAPHTGLDVEITPVPLDHLAGVVRVDPAVSSQVGG
jgi:cell wall-associated NlpC family hydrolase